ncbi:hypothetical protein ACPDI4_001027, partial [Campylobacter upsaliensis]
KGAVEKLLAEQQGQVSGAFYKEGLGDIVLVWGDENFGLRHILNKHGDEFEDIAEELNKIIQNGEVVKRKGRDEAYNIEYKGFKVGINKGFNKQGKNKWVVTAFNDNIEKTAKTAPANDSTKGASLPLNSKESIAQNSEKLPFEMQVFTEDKLSGDEVRHLANKIGEKSTIGYFKKYLLKMDRDFHARAKDIIREYYKIEPFRKELENQWANVKEAYKNGEMSLKEFKFLSKYKDEKSFLNQVAEVLWYHSDELVKNRGYTINKYGGVEQGKGDNYYQNLALEYDGALKSLKKWFYYIQKANKQAKKFFNKKELEDFGVNFEGFKGKEAVLKLLEEKRGQVKGAFYKEGLGEIDLVWGDENFGLKHILNKHGDEFEDIAEELSEAMEKGVLKKQNEVRSRIEFKDFAIGLSGEFKGEKHAFIITAFKRKGKSSTLSPKQDFTDKSDDVLSNQESIIPQRNINLAMEKFHYDEAKAKDLLEWHKDSSPLTKDENGLPKVFYHGSGASFKVFKKEFDEIKTGFWFADRKMKAEEFAKDKGGKAIYPVFLKMKNPIWLTYQKEGDKWVFDWLDDEGKTLLKEAKNQSLSIDYFQKDFKFKEFLQSKGYDGIILKSKINGILEHSVFNPNQIKHIDNKGLENKSGRKYFNEKSENIYYSNPHLGAGLVGGVLNGVEQDEEGNLSFDPAKFVMGFLGGAVGSKAVSSAYNKAKAKYYEKNFNKFIDEVNAKKEQIKPRFTLTQELEKAYRENELKIKQSAAEKLNLKGKIFADYIKLAQKHPEYFANPQEAKELSEFIAQNASVGIKASKKEYELIFAEIQGGKGVFALDLEYKGGKHRIRSVYLMKNMQYKKKLFEAKKLGEPILQF